MAFLFVQFRNDPKRRLAPRHALHIVKSITQTGDIAVLRGAGHMRGQNHIIQVEQRIIWRRRFLIKHIKPGGGGS